MKTKRVFAATLTSLVIAGFGMRAATDAPPAEKSASTQKAEKTPPPSPGRGGGTGKQAPKSGADATTNYEDKDKYYSDPTHTAIGNPDKPASHGSPAVDRSPTTLIGGGTPQSGGPPIAPSASVIAERISQWKLSADDLKSELEKGGEVVRMKTPGPGDPTGKLEDPDLTTLIHNRFMADSQTVKQTLHVDVNNGDVKLRGKVSSPEVLGRAIAIALDTSGVAKVTSELKVEPTVKPAATTDEKK
jgi:hypothetical protein